MANPTIGFWQLNTAGNPSTAGGNNQINQIGGGGPSATLVAGTANGSGSSGVFDFGADEAGVWSTPTVLLVEFDGGTISHINFQLWNLGTPDLTTPGPGDIVIGMGGSSSEDFFPSGGTPWQFGMRLFSNYVNPTTISTVAACRSRRAAQSAVIRFDI